MLPRSIKWLQSLVVWPDHVGGGEKNDRQILIWWLICGVCLTKTLESADLKIDETVIPARLTATRPMSRSQPRASSNALILLNYEHVEHANGFPFPPPPPTPPPLRCRLSMHWTQKTTSTRQPSPHSRRPTKRRCSRFSPRPERRYYRFILCTFHQ